MASHWQDLWTTGLESHMAPVQKAVKEAGYNLASTSLIPLVLCLSQGVQLKEESMANHLCVLTCLAGLDGTDILRVDRNGWGGGGARMPQNAGGRATGGFLDYTLSGCITSF